MRNNSQYKYNVRGVAQEKWGATRICTVNLPELDLAYIKKFIDETRLTPSRSEYIRVALRNQIIRDIEMVNTEKAIIKGALKFDPEKFVLVPGYNGNKPLKIIRRLETPEPAIERRLEY